MGRIGPTLAEELKSKEQATGLALLKPGVSWTDQGMDPLPKGLTDEERAAIEAVLTEHDPDKPSPKPDRGKDHNQFMAALALVPPGPVADALAALRKLIQG
jgi:hypothetical protein